MESQSDRLIREAKEARAAAASADPDPQSLVAAEVERMGEIVQQVTAGLESAVGPTAEARSGRSAIGALSGALNTTLVAQGAYGQSACVTVQVLGRPAGAGLVECDAEVTYAVRSRPGVRQATGAIGDLTQRGIELELVNALQRYA